MENKIFEVEKERLDYILKYIDDTLFSESPNEANLRQYIIDERRRIWDDYSQSPDNVELMQANQTLEMDTERYFRIKDKLYFLEKMRSSPYFARIDFTEEGSEESESFYIGALSLIDKNTYEILICDWRADIASLFYDSTLGPSEYRCQQGTIRGDITLRRQIKIEDAQLKYVFDNGINITDPILMQELGRSTDAKLKTVINTIQREQNLVIRDLNADLLLVQGSAGSGKTSVALHRLAFLMYHFRNTISAQDMIIFSPSEIFSSYIAEVLPELGEENAVRSDFYHFFADFESDFRYGDRSDQIEALLKSSNPGLQFMIAEKGSKSFAEALKSFYEKRVLSFSIDRDVSCFDVVLATAEDLSQWFFRDYASYLPMQRVGKIITRVMDVADEHREAICHAFLDEATAHGIIAYTDEEKVQQCEEMWNSCMAELTDEIKKLLLVSEKEIYLEFLREYNGEYFEYTHSMFKQNVIPYEDLFCLSWLKLCAGTISPMRTVRHIVIDEAQEHPEIAYLLLDEIFPNAKFTILGDIAQQVDAKISSVESLKNCFPTKKTVVTYHLNKSYRSTLQINEFSKKFRTEDSFDVINRQGEAVLVEQISDPVKQVRQILARNHAQGHKTNMILCRTQEECDFLYQILKREIPVIRLRSYDTFTTGTTAILPIYLSKGLEADGVIIYGFSSAWDTAADRNLMYVASTRALHSLSVLCDGGCELLN